MLRSSFVLILFSLLTQVIGLGLQIALANKFGTGQEVDAYIAALTLPGVVEALALAAVAQLLLPLLVRRFASGQAAEAWRVLSTLVWLLAGGLLLLSIPVAFGRLTLVRAVAPGLDGATLRLAGDYLALLFPGMAFGVAGALLTQAFHARRRFTLPALAGAASQLAPLAAVLLLSDRLGLWSLIGGTLAAKVLALAPLVWILAQEGAPLRPRIEIKHPEVRRLAWLALPVVVAVTSARLNGAVDRFFVSFLGEGKLSSLGYADLVVGLVLAVLVSPVAAVVYPGLADREAQSDRAGLFWLLVRGSRWVITGMLPFALLICLLASPALTLVFEHGRFSGADTARVAGILACYGGIILLGGVGSLLVRGFYAIGNTRDPMIWGGLLPLAANVILDALVFRRWDVYGVAAVTSANAVLGIPILYVILRRRLGVAPLGGWTGFCIRLGVAGGFMALVTHALAGRIPDGADGAAAAVALCLAAFGGLTAYGAAGWLLRIEPFLEVAARFRLSPRPEVVAVTGVPPGVVR